MKAELAKREAPPLKFNSAKDIAPRDAELWAYNIEDAIRRAIVGGFRSATVEPPKGLHARIIKGLEAAGRKQT